MQQPLLLNSLKQRLIEAVDATFHVTNAGEIAEVLGDLERMQVTVSMLEESRLGKVVNEFRKKTDDAQLAKRAKALVKKWRAILDSQGSAPGQQGHGPVNGNAGGPHVLNHLRPGYTSNSSSPVLGIISSSNNPTNARISPNSNSLSPRVLSNLSTNRNIGVGIGQGRNGQSHSTALSSPGLGPLSPNIRITSPSVFGNKTKSPFGPSISPAQQLNNRILSNVNSYAPNAEVVARTNAANKRLRIEDEGGVGTNSPPPPLKKMKRMANGGLEGALDDPTVIYLDDLSKDSVASRTSEHDHTSEGSSSKPVSLVPSAEPSPLSLNPDSNVTSPASVVGGFGAECSEALPLHDEDNKTSYSITDDATSAAFIGATSMDQQDGQINAGLGKQRGRKKKEKGPAGLEQKIFQQIAMANQEKMRRQRMSLEVLEEDHSRHSMSDQLSPDPIIKSTPTTLAALSPDESLSNKSDMVEKWRMHSQNELRTNRAPTSQQSPTTTVEESKKKKKRDKKKNKSAVEEVQFPPFPTESEILARLPPIDPQILEELKDFQFYVEESEPEVVDKDKPKSENETDIESLNSASEPKTQVKTEEPTPAAIPKIDWGDSDDDEEFDDVSAKKDAVEEKEAPSTEPVDEVDAAPLSTLTKDQPLISLPSEDEKPLSSPTPMDISLPEEEPLREIEDWEIERLHIEKVDNLNGNKDKDGEFKEWQEVLSVHSYKGDLLHILPYTIIDF